MTFEQVTSELFTLLQKVTNDGASPGVIFAALSMAVVHAERNMNAAIHDHSQAAQEKQAAVHAEQAEQAGQEKQAA